ncbi:PR domain zinc finger protein 5-like isoform X10 [Anopheles funestus]|uniref:PR domain zinc finger protein 5-like n=1 Tax=Anopheles funestus TaxID=62324 RepID=UPI0020C5D655|nr:PR domain zinc finger protein 5-like [Anopheles funestus]
MANILRELSDICRFCLCQNVKQIIPIAKTLDKLLTVADIERFTGIQLSNMSHAVCLECLNKLKMSAEFRTFCMSNDSRFQMLHSMLVESAEKEAIECAESSDDDIDMLDFDGLDENDTKNSCNESVSSETYKEEISYTEEHIKCRSQNMERVHDEKSAEDYSANYIEPGVTLVSDEEDIDPRDLIYTALNPSYPRVGSCQRVKGKRRLHLCDACGKMVIDISYHYFTHATEATFACPHCPAMIKTKNSLLAHIKTVHFKMITKTCEICGKGFVHHKTYRYHMSAHKSEGDSYECKPCSRTFNHPSGYQQHLKRFHSISKKIK